MIPANEAAVANPAAIVITKCIQHDQREQSGLMDAAEL
jgi:hypothetical protein